ncbi:MAG TPA: zinc metalloprotease HtpX [Methanocorpusculum sp.]|nr:zinc metalloprotease HtpX [Methanocorpusculum sp.]
MIWKRDWGLIGRQVVAWMIILLLYVIILTVVLVFLKGTLMYFLIGLVFVMAFVQYFFSDKLVQRSMKVMLVDEDEEPQLYAMVRRLATEANLPMPKVGIIQHRAMANIPNAFATGRNPRNAVVAVTPKIRSVLTDDELEAVLAHEISHVKNRDMLTMTIGSFAVMLATIILQNQFMLAIFGGDRNSDNGGGIVIFILAMVVTFIVYIVGTIVTMAISRYREFSADRGSAYLTRDPDALIRALKKISSGVDAASPDAKQAVSGTNSFFIIPAISGKSVMELFSTHPPLEKRIANLEKVRAEIRGY